jgi:hypothetical protein
VCSASSAASGRVADRDDGAMALSGKSVSQEDWPNPCSHRIRALQLAILLCAKVVYQWLLPVGCYLAKIRELEQQHMRQYSGFSIARGCAHRWSGFHYANLCNAADTVNAAGPEAVHMQLAQFIAICSYNTRLDTHGLLQWVRSRNVGLTPPSHAAVGCCTVKFWESCLAAGHNIDVRQQHSKSWLLVPNRTFAHLACRTLSQMSFRKKANDKQPWCQLTTAPKQSKAAHGELFRPQSRFDKGFSTSRQKSA